jgi:hypothetical protein
METAVKTNYDKALEAEPQITAVITEIAAETGELTPRKDTPCKKSSPTAHV